MNSYENLLSRIRVVRRRWRLQMLVKGAALFFASVIALLILGIWGADLFGFRPAAVWTMRAVTAALALLVAVRFVILPLLRRVSDVQIAQYVEERFPELEDRLISAVEFGKGAGGTPTGILDLLIKDAFQKTARLDLSVFLNHRKLLSYGAAGAGTFLVLLALLNWGPAFFPYGFDRLYVQWTEASAGTPLLIEVAPGNAEITKGNDLEVKARLLGFDSPEVELYMQPEGSTAWTPTLMKPERLGSGFQYLLVDLQSSLRYYVQAKGIRSRIYALNVVELPSVERIDLTYRFPAYTGMSPQTVEGEGEISALKGTKVELAVRTNKPVASARLLFDDQSSLELASAGGSEFKGELSLLRSGAYVVQLTDDSGAGFAGSPEYPIEAIEDNAPRVMITKPLRDLRATNVEEVFSEIKAEDDIGVGSVDLHYSVNGNPEKSIRLFNGKPVERSVTSGHTFFLEEFALQPGDVVSYYGTAADSNNVTGPGTAASDIYFIQIRPFEQTYRQSQQGGGGGAQGGGRPQEALSKQQKDIISATFKLIRDKDTMDRKEYVDGLKALALVQSRLQSQVQGVVARLQRRGATQAGPEFASLAEYMSRAIEEMEKAAVDLGALRPEDALPAEQRALQQLMRAESLFNEIQISFANQSGGGGGSQASAEDLADLFELELNKLKNQYETVQRGEQQARDEELDEAMQRLKELAQRQQQLNERMRQMGRRGASSPSSSGGGGSQEQLMSEAEQLQRQLQRLSRERSSPELNRVSNQLRQAIEEMKQALNRQRAGRNNEAGAQGVRALQQLEEATRSLARDIDSGLSQGLEQAVQESRQILDEQKRIREGIDRLARDRDRAETAESQQRRQNLSERKTVLADRLRNLQENIEDLGRQSRRSEQEANRKLNEASGTIRERKLPERIMSGNRLLEGGYYDSLVGREAFIEAGLEDLARQLQEAKSGLGQTREGRLADAVDRTRQLAEGLESMQRKFGAQPPQGAQDQQGRQGQQAQQSGQGGRQPQSGEQMRAGGARNPQNPQAGAPSRRADENAGSAFAPPAGPGRFSNEDIRQLRSEFDQRLRDAQELRRLMDQNPTEMDSLEKVIETLRALHAARRYEDPEEAARLKNAIALLHQMELNLGRDLASLTQKDKYLYGEDNGAPSSYRKLVEEYYKALARKPE